LLLRRISEQPEPRTTGRATHVLDDRALSVQLRWAPSATRKAAKPMLLEIPAVLTPQQVAHIRSRLEAGPWVDGNVTSGHQSAQAKCNEQLAEESPVARELGAHVMEALGRNALFFSAALPKQVFPPLFNRYREGMNFGSHVDGAIRTHEATRH